MCCIHWQNCNKCDARWQQAYRPCSGVINEGECDWEECVGSFVQDVDSTLCPTCNPQCSPTEMVMPEWRPIRQKAKDCEDCQDPDCGEEGSKLTKKSSSNTEKLPATSQGNGLLLDAPITTKATSLVAEQTTNVLYGPPFRGRDPISTEIFEAATGQHKRKFQSLTADGGEQSSKGSKNKSSMSMTNRDEKETSVSEGGPVRIEEDEMEISQAGEGATASHHNNAWVENKTGDTKHQAGSDDLRKKFFLI